MSIDNTEKALPQVQKQQHTEKHGRKSNRLRVHEGVPAFAGTQRDTVLALLDTAGTNGIYREHFLDGTGPLDGKKIRQVGARLDELEEMGYKFKSEWKNPGDTHVTYYLLEKPLEPKPLPLFRRKKKARGDSPSSSTASRNPLNAAVEPQQKTPEAKAVRDWGGIRYGQEERARIERERQEILAMTPEQRHKELAAEYYGKQPAEKRTAFPIKPQTDLFAGFDSGEPRQSSFVDYELGRNKAS